MVAHLRHIVRLLYRPLGRDFKTSLTYYKYVNQVLDSNVSKYYLPWVLGIESLVRPVPRPWNGLSPQSPKMALPSYITVESLLSDFPTRFSLIGLVDCERGILSLSR